MLYLFLPSEIQRVASFQTDWPKYERVDITVKIYFFN